MNMAVFAVIFLFIVVAIAFWRKCNIGVLAVGSSLILGLIGGVSGKEILGSEQLPINLVFDRYHG